MNSHSRVEILGALAAVLALAAPAAALAQAEGGTLLVAAASDAELPSDGEGEADLGLLADDAPRSRISIGFDTVAGERRYADRADNGSGAAVVRFSATRPRAGMLGGIPDGLPVSSVRLTSRYGNRVHPVTGRRSSHAGVDLAVPTGTPVAATSDGQVKVAGWAGNYGVLVVIEHGDGVQTHYGHLSSVAVEAGQSVAKGQVIGRSGSTGRTTGPHVHYEVRIDGRPVNPIPSE